MSILRKRKFFCCLGRRNAPLVFLLICFISVAMTGCWMLSVVASRAILPPEPPDQNLQHLRRNRSLKHYLDNVQLLIEPSSVSCNSDTSLVVLVTSSPSRFDNRQAIRSTWGKHQPTYFLLGIRGTNVDENLVDNYVEAKHYSDLIVFDLHDHYQNLTLKTALMMQWTLDRCPDTNFMLKTDDDVFINPWMLEEVVRDNSDAELIGYLRKNGVVHRDEYNKWYLPRWLCRDDVISNYLDGNAYLIKGAYLKTILEAAYKVPLINLEDVYFTHFVALRSLGLNLTSEHRMSPFRPWLQVGCAYWRFATVHSLRPQEMVHVWSKISSIAIDYKSNKNVCSFFNRYFGSDLFLY